MREFLDVLRKIWAKKRALNTASGEKEKLDDNKKISAKLDVSDDYLELAKAVYDIKTQCKEDKKMRNTVSKETRKALTATEVKICSMCTDIDEINNLKDTYCDSTLSVAITNLVDIYNIYICNEVDMAEEWCTLNIDLMKGQELTPKYIILAILTQLQLNFILYAKNAQLEERYSCLSEALFLYCTYTAKETYPNPIVYDNLFDERETNPNSILDSLHITTLKQLITIYILSPREKHKFVLYMHKLLKDTMEEALLQSGHLEWSITCANLVFYFIYHNRLPEAKSHLLIASKILMEFFNTKIKNTTMTDKTSDREIITRNKYVNAMCLVNLIWVQYGLEILRMSHERLLKCEDSSTNNLPCEVDNSSLTAPLLFDISEPVIIHTINESLDYQSCTDQYLINFDDVMKLFMFMKIIMVKIVKCFIRQNNFYRLGETYLYWSRVCKYMFYFDRRCSKENKWHIGRIKNLQAAIKKLNESTDSHVKNLCHILYLELGLAYCTYLNDQEEVLVRTGEHLNKEATETLYGTVKQILSCFNHVTKYDDELKNHNA